MSLPRSPAVGIGIVIALLAPIAIAAGRREPARRRVDPSAEIVAALATTGDAAGGDDGLLPRPRDSVRVLATPLAEAGVVRVYATDRTESDCIAELRQAAEERGLVVLRDDGRLTFARGEQRVVVTAKAHGVRTLVTFVELGAMR